MFLYPLLSNRCSQTHVIEGQGLVGPDRVSHRVEMQPQFPATEVVVRRVQNFAIHCGSTVVGTGLGLSALVGFLCLGLLSRHVNNDMICVVERVNSS